MDCLYNLESLSPSLRHSFFRFLFNNNIANKKKKTNNEIILKSSKQETVYNRRKIIRVSGLFPKAILLKLISNVPELVFHISKFN